MVLEHDRGGENKGWRTELAFKVFPGPTHDRGSPCFEISRWSNTGLCIELRCAIVRGFDIGACFMVCKYCSNVHEEKCSHVE